MTPIENWPTCQHSVHRHEPHANAPISIKFASQPLLPANHAAGSPVDILSIVTNANASTSINFALPYMPGGSYPLVFTVKGFGYMKSVANMTNPFMLLK